jgi:hypothetical protein
MNPRVPFCQSLSKLFLDLDLPPHPFDGLFFGAVAGYGAGSDRLAD